MNKKKFKILHIGMKRFLTNHPTKTKQCSKCNNSLSNSFYKNKFVYMVLAKKLTCNVTDVTPVRINTSRKYCSYCTLKEIGEIKLNKF